MDRTIQTCQQEKYCDRPVAAGHLLYHNIIVVNDNPYCLFSMKEKAASCKCLVLGLVIEFNSMSKAYNMPVDGVYGMCVKQCYFHLMDTEDKKK